MNADATPTFTSTADDILGWYRLTTSAEPMRVWIMVESRTLGIFTLSGRLVGRWSLDRLENRTVPVIGRTWLIGDRHLAEPVLELESDHDYRAIQKVSTGLRSLRARWWHGLAFSVIESKIAGGLLLLLAVTGIPWLWKHLSFAQCIATGSNGILFLKCFIFDHFIR